MMCRTCNVNHPKGWACPKELDKLRAELAEAKRRNLVSFQTDMGPCDFIPVAQADEEIATLRTKLAKAEAALGKADARLEYALVQCVFLCPVCGGIGWYADGDHLEPEQVQCDCRTEVLNVFDKCISDDEARAAKGEG